MFYLDNILSTNDDISFIIKLLEFPVELKALINVYKHWVLTQWSKTTKNIKTIFPINIFNIKYISFFPNT